MRNGVEGTLSGVLEAQGRQSRRSWPGEPAETAHLGAKRAAEERNW